MNLEPQLLRYDHQGQSLELLLKRSRRKTLVMYVHRNRPVEVRAPLRYPLREIESFVRQRLDWIQSASAELAKQPVNIPPGYQHGSIRPFLGHDHLLLLREGRKKQVVSEGYQLLVTLPPPLTESRVKQTLQDRYKVMAQSFLEGRLAQVLERFPDHWQVNSLVIRKMKARWGSCSRNGVICLNSLLMEQPVAAIDFVICHELCHLRHFHHGRGFYQLLDRVMPDWRLREKSMNNLIS